MPYTAETVARIEATLPPSNVTKAALQNYLNCADMSRPQFASMTGYSLSAINLFLAGTYTKYNVRTDVVLRRAIEDAMRRHPIGLPETEVQGSLYETENVRDLRKWFEHCHRNRALAFCYGPPGSQKTYTIRHLVCEFNRRELPRTDASNRAYYVYVSVRMQPRDLLVKLCEQAGATIGNSLQRCMRGLRNTLAHTKTVFVLDEAQHLNIDCLEALREMHDESPRIGALLAGSHELKKLFDRRAAELEQWNSRLQAGIELAGVSEKRAVEILRTELPQLSERGIAKAIASARVTDAYSRTHPTYLNIRRLFNILEVLRVEMNKRSAKEEE